MIDKDEFKEYTNSINSKLNEIEKQIKLSNINTASEDNINKNIRKKVNEIEMILKRGEFTNEDLKKVIDRINVNKNGNVEIILKDLEHFDCDNEVMIRDVSDVVEENVETRKNMPSNCNYLTTVHTDVGVALLGDPFIYNLDKIM